MRIEEAIVRLERAINTGGSRVEKARAALAAYRKQESESC